MASIAERTTFVMQGPIIEGVTRECLESIRLYFPESLILLSTWNGSNVDDLDFDECVLSDDPGGQFYSNQLNSRQNNVNRQIISTLRGLDAVNTKYVFKIRTDFAISGRGFLEFWQRFRRPCGPYKVFDERMLACCYFARNPAGLMRMPFHPSDLAFFGMTSDVRRLFDIPLMTETEAYWYADKGALVNRFVPEQYIFINCLKKSGREIDCQHYHDISGDNIKETEMYFAENFTMLEFEQFCLISKRPGISISRDPKSFSACYTHIEWLRLYERYVDPSISIPAVDVQRRFIEDRKRRYGVYRKIANIITLIVIGRVRRHRMRERIIMYLMTRKCG